MLNNYLTEDEFCQKYSPYQKGQTVNLIEPAKCDYGIYEIGTEVVIKNVTLKDYIKLPEMLSSEVDDFYADGRMFKYEVQLRSIEENTPTFYIDIDFIEKVKLCKIEFIKAAIGTVVASVYLIGAIALTGYEDYSCWLMICSFIIAFITLGWYTRCPEIHKKRKREQRTTIKSD
ncbi:MAG: hypothetical protein NC485_10360 [Ruminococcus flavefaciens]|nr:hypothetical protein [Ruminococcus flavefaciens]MCM1059299.1 hypothetical protein [Eubacterium sp.]